MASPLIQPSFSAGEIAPHLQGRVDLQKYHAALAVCRNFFVDYRGGASTRPGTEYVGVARSSTAAPRLIRFVFSTSQTYMLVLDAGTGMRIINNGGFVLETPFSVTAATAQSPLVLTIPGHNFLVGDDIYLSGVSGLARPNGISGVNGRTLRVTVVSGTSITFQDLINGPINGAAWTAYASGGSAARVYTVTTPWAGADLPLLGFAQSADVLTITHPNYPPYDVKRLGTTNWQVVPVAIGTSLTAPTGQTATAINNVTTNNQFFYAYTVTAVDTATNEESNATASCTVVNQALSQTSGVSNKITWTAVAGATAYNIYAAQRVPSGSQGVAPYFWGLMGRATSPSFQDVNFSADFNTGPPNNANPLTGNAPGLVSYFEQRRVFAASTNSPDTFWMTRPGLYSNFDTSFPSQGDDAITGTILTQEANQITSLTPMSSGLIALTSDGAYQISGGVPNAALSPSAITAQAQAFAGAAPIPPLRINYDLLYVQARGWGVRDLSYNFYVNVYTGTDVSALSSHLLFGRQIKNWCYAEQPFYSVWTVLDNGVLLGFTYLKDQEVYGWSRHDTFGMFENVASVEEGAEDAVYFVINRLLGGQWVYTIERFATRFFGGDPAFNSPAISERAWCVDAGAAYPLTYPAASITAGTSADGLTFTFTTSVPRVTSANIGQVVRLAAGIGTVQTVPTPTTFTAYMNVAPEILQNAATYLVAPVAQGSWSMTAPVTVAGGLDHLNGLTVSALADGSVVPPQVVVDGCITLPAAASYIVAGLPFTAQLQTLRVDAGEPTLQGRRKQVPAVTVRAVETRGLMVGARFDDMVAIDDRTSESMGSPTRLQQGGGVVATASVFAQLPVNDPDKRIVIPTEWTEEGQVCIMQSYPLPATITALIPEVETGDQPSQ